MRKKFFLLIILSLILIGLDYLKISKIFTKQAEPLITEIKDVIYQRTHHLKFVPTVIFNFENIVTEIGEKQKLTNENKQNRIKIQDLEEENNSLRKQLGAPLPPEFKFIPAEVIAISRYMEINIGSNNGVIQGMAVVEGTTLVGKILKTTEVRSQVQLLTDSDLSVPAISNRGSRGNIVGQLGEYMVFKDVLQKDPLFLEDIIMTSGEGELPKELLIGSVAKIDSDDADVYKSARIKSNNTYSLIKKVFVVAEK